MSKRILLLLCTLAGCMADPNTDDSNGNPLTPRSDLALVLTSNFDSSSVDAFDPKDPTRMAKRLVLVSGDAVITRTNQTPIVIDRGRFETLTVLTQQLTVANQFRIKHCGPHDLAPVGPNLALVTCYDASTMLLVNLQTGDIKQQIDLSPWADTDGIPEADHVIRFNDHLLLTIQKLDRNNTFVPAGKGQVLRMHIENNRITDTIDTAELPCANPFTSWVQTGSTFVVACAGFRNASDSAIVRIDPNTLKTTTIANAGSLGGIPHELAALTDGSLVVLISIPESTVAEDKNPVAAKEMRLIRLRQNGTVETLHTYPGYSLTGLAVIDGVIYFGNRSNTHDAGLWWIDGQQLHGPVKTSLPPFVIIP